MTRSKQLLINRCLIESMNLLNQIIGLMKSAFCVIHQLIILVNFQFLIE